MTTSATPEAAAKALEITSLMYSSGRYSDLIIDCQGRIFNIHRSVVCLQSKPISAMIDGEFVEGISRVIKLPENDPNVVEKMIEYMYHGDYSDGLAPAVLPPADIPDTSSHLHRKNFLKKSRPSGPPPHVPEEPEQAQLQVVESDSSLLEPDYISKWPFDWLGAPFLNTQVYAIAEQYDIPSLKKHATQKYAKAITREWNSASFVASLQHMYDLTPESDRMLKEVALKTAAEHLKELTDRGEFVDLCKERGDIAVDVLKISVCLNLIGSAEACPNGCGNIFLAVQPTRIHGHYFCGNCKRWFN